MDHSPLESTGVARYSNDDFGNFILTQTQLEPKTKPTASKVSRTGSPEIRALLDRLRGAIRRYVWIQGIALVVIWLVLSFWCALGLDYLPVLFGLNELPWQVRAVLLVLIGIGLVWVLYRWILRRAFVRLHDRSLAILIERRFDQFHDSLVTSVQFGDAAEVTDSANTDAVNLEMLEQTRVQAKQQIAGIDLAQVFNRRPLQLAIIGAVGLLLTICAFGLLNHRALALGSSRIYMLDEKPWPRGSHIEVVGIRIKREEPLPGIPEMQETKSFAEGNVRVTKGSNLELLVRADADLQANPDRQIPRYCTIFYTTADGQRGRQDMNKVGRPQDGFQLYQFNQQPFSGIVSDTRFDVRGGDHRIGSFEIQVVDVPTLIKTELACQFPKYMVDEVSGAWTERTIRLTPGTQLPVGTELTLHLTSNKPLQKAFLHNPLSGETHTIPVAAATQLSWTWGQVVEPIKLEVSFLDTEGVYSDAPYPIQIGAVDDLAPKIAARISGIGTAITPTARVPFAGKITDDYGVARTWIEFQTSDSEPQRKYFDVDQDGEVRAEIDFEQLLRSETERFELVPDEGARLTISLKAEDRFDLTGKPNVANGDRYMLDIVTPAEMSRILERLEVGQRRRLEQIHEEMTSANEYLIRVKLGSELNSEAVEPGDRTGSSETKAEREKLNKGELTLLYAQRALLQSRKSGQEIIGVSETFFDIRDQLVNNRLDRKDKKMRLENDIAAPLAAIGNEIMPELELRISALEAKLKTVATAYNEQNQEAVDVACDAAIEQAGLVLTRIDDILKILVKYESYSELLDVVRKMYQDQQELLDKTKKERRKEQIGNLLD
jgi:hypothetical protein